MALFCGGGCYLGNMQCLKELPISLYYLVGQPEERDTVLHWGGGLQGESSPSALC